MKKKIAVLALVLSLLSISIMGTFAYFTDTAVAHNIITTDHIEGNIAILETQLQEGTEVTYPLYPIEIMPGQAISKIVRVENEGDQPAYIRAKYILKVVDGPALKEGMVQINIGEDWTQKESDDGWYYYKEPLVRRTTEFFSEVYLDGPLTTNEYQNCTLNVIVVVQAVQSVNNSDSALTAQGWPQEILGE